VIEGPILATRQTSEVGVTIDVARDTEALGISGDPGHGARCPEAASRQENRSEQDNP
jgi:hypothetical protein